MSILTFPVPTPEQIAVYNERGGRGIIQYRKAARVTLANGEEAEPTLSLARLILNAAADGLLIPVAVEVGHYVNVTEREAAEALRMERFRLFCKEDGHNGYRRETARCDTCDTRGPGRMDYAPDAMGYPAPVLFWGDCCHSKEA